MQSYTEVSAVTTLENSRVPLLNNDKTIMSQHSGTAFPTFDLQIGMACHRTDEKKLYVLESTGPSAWTLVFDFNKTVVMQEDIGSVALLKASNLSDVADSLTAFNNIKQGATLSSTGAVELTTNVEAQTGTDASRAVTPAALRTVTATQTRAGLIEIATVAEINAGTSDARALSPLGVAGSKLLTAGGTATLTDKTFDANDTGNILRNVDVADLADGVDGELISWGTDGKPIKVAVGTVGQQLTSNGAGAPPTFQTGVFVPAGAIFQFGGTAVNVPSGYLACDGKAVNRTTYAVLFTAIGTLHGVGDGSSTFNLPDFRGKSAIGVNDTGLPNGADSDFTTRNEADTGGAETHSLITGELAAHIHTYSGRGTKGTGNQIIGNGSAAPGASVSSSSTGNGDAHNNMQPFLAVNYMIKT